MPKSFSPLLKKRSRTGSVIVGADDSFDLCDRIIKAQNIQVAIAFAHMSGWNVISSALKSTKALSIQILIGRSFFLTEPAVLLELKKLSATDPRIEVKLADMRVTFHPKVWIFQDAIGGSAIVGSGNLSGGGIGTNVECASLVREPDEIAGLQEWFGFHWKIGQELSIALDQYVLQYEKMRNARQQVDSLCKQASDEISAKEAKKLKSRAELIAESFWSSPKGEEEIKRHLEAIREMRRIFNYPHFKFDPDAYQSFMKIEQFGSIREAHTDKTIAALPELQEALRAAQVGSSDYLSALLHIKGVGRNIATKLLAMIDPEKYVVINGPVIACLEAFGIDTTALETENLTEASYEKFLKNVDAFSDLAFSKRLQRASALDTFFFEFRGTKYD